MKNLLLCGSLLFASSAFSQVLTEDFEGLGGALPAGWASNSTTAGAGDWITGDASVANSAGFWPVPSTSDFAQVNDDACNCNLSAAYLVSPSMNFSGLAGVVLTYDFVDDLTYGGNPHIVQVSTNGTTWTDVYTYAPTAAVIDWQPNLVSLGAATNGAATVWVRFKYDDAGAWATGLAIDNVVVSEPLANDASIAGISLTRWALISTNNPLSVDVQNVGSNAITGLTIDWNDGASHAQTVVVNIAPGATATVAHPTNVTYATAVEETISVTITATNGGADGDASNNSASGILHNTLSQATDKAVVIEEGTGTWCGWCPRGAVAMDYMTATYPADFIGIAVHNGDPMTVAPYDAAAAFSGFPGSNVDRSLLGVSVSQGLFEQYYNDRVNMGVPANISAVVTGTGASVTVDVTADFYTPVTGANFRLAVVITEDGVTGTTAAYNQANYYAGGGQGAMGGYEALTDPVPAANMVYDHVGRALLGGYMGQAGSVPATIVDGTTATYSFTYTVPGTSNRDNMHAVALLIDNNSGEIVNAKQVSISESGGIGSVDAISMNVFPNPANDIVNVSFEATGDYSITLTDMAGRVVSTTAFSNLSGAQSIAIPVADLMSGNYILSVANGVGSSNQIVVIK